MHGQFVWYELMTSDADAAKRFYAPITSWGTQPFDQSYTMWTTGGAPFGGLQQLGPKEREQGIPPNWMPYVESSNVAETVRLASSLGARIIEGPRDIPGAGTFAVIQDPQRAVFGVYDPKGQSEGWDGAPVVGRFSWHELMTDDHGKAFEFYKRLFGWDKTGEMEMGPGNSYLMYGKGQQPYGGIYRRPAEMTGTPPSWLCYINVKDVQKAVATAKKNGAVVRQLPMDVPGGVIAVLSDPQGAAFAVHQVTASPAASRPAPRKGHKTGSKTAAKKTRGKTKSALKKTRLALAKKSRGAVKKSRGAVKKRRVARKSARRSATAKRRGAKSRGRRSR